MNRQIETLRGFACMLLVLHRVTVSEFIKRLRVFNAPNTLV